RTVARKEALRKSIVVIRDEAYGNMIYRGEFKKAPRTLLYGDVKILKRYTVHFI
ncbi:unnamed protein product, partial [marine sediment metagenome]